MVLEKLQDKFTKYEIARILGARSLQLAMDAPVLLKLTKEEEDNLNWDTLRIAEKELEAGVLPITVRRPLPKRSQKTIKKLTEEEIKEKLEEQAKLEKKEIEQEVAPKEVAVESEDGESEKDGETKDASGDEIMEMANPDDEVESSEEDSVEEYE